MTSPLSKLRVAERVFIIAGLAAIAFYLAARGYGEAMRRAEIERFESARKEHLAQAADPAASPPAVTRRTLNVVSDVDTRLWSPQRVRHYKDQLGADVGSPLAILRIPRIGLEVPVLNGTDELRLNRGVGWIEGTARPGEAGNSGIAGHRDGFFRGLKDVRPGDAVTLETLDASLTYVVDEIRIVDPAAVDVLRPTAVSAITLVTCYPFYYVGDAPRRYAIRARRAAGDGNRRARVHG